MEDHRALFPGICVPVPEISLACLCCRRCLCTTGSNCCLIYHFLVDNWQKFGCPAERWTEQTSCLYPHIKSALLMALVEVTLQHKAIYNRLESEHWWVLTDEFYHVRSLQLQF